MAISGLFFVGIFPHPNAEAQLPTNCNVTGNIQLALNLAAPGSTLTVCGGLYAEALRVEKDGITLEGRPGAILDGSLLTGTRHGVTIADGILQFTLRGFEIRNYNDSSNVNDSSSGIVSEGSSYGVNVVNNHIHHNGFAGILLANGFNPGWTVENNTIRANEFANILTQSASSLVVHNNTIKHGVHAIVLAAARSANVSWNNITGNGTAAVVLTPHLQDARPSRDVNLSRNAITGAWTHGVWSGASERLTLLQNFVEVDGTAMTLAGDPLRSRLIANEASPIYETRNFTRIEGLFGLGGPAAGQGTPANFPVDCSAECTAETIRNLLATATLQSSLPNQDPQGVIDDLTACAGQPDSCLVSQFFDSADTSPSNGWTIDIAPGVTAHFIAAGTRLPSETKAWRYRETDLAGERETLVICRLQIGLAVTSCALAPRVFDFGLDTTWYESEYAQHASKWRLKLPTDLVHASFDYFHAADSTLFLQSSQTHHAQSPPLLPSIDPPTPDPLRAAYGGTGILRCIIVPGGSAATVGAPHDDCGDPILLRQPSTPTFLWCTADLTALAGSARTDENVHQARPSEIASGLWAWSDTCATSDDRRETNWTLFYTPSDLAALSDAQTDYYAATLAADKEEAARRAENVTLRAAGRHLARRVTGQGTPTAPNFLTPTLSSGHDVVLLEWESEASANLALDSLQAVGATGAWETIDVPALAGFEPVRVNLMIHYRSLDGELHNIPFTILLQGEETNVTQPFIVRYAANRTGNIVAWPGENRDYETAYSADGRRTHTFSLIEANAPPSTLLGMGLIDAGFPLGDADSIEICTKTLLTANASGTKGNFVDPTVLGVETPDDACISFEELNEVTLRYFANVVVTAEIRLGDGPLSAAYEVIGEPLRHGVDKDDPSASIDLGQLAGLAESDPWGVAVRPGTLRLVITLPEQSPPDPTGLAFDIAAILQALGPSVTIFAIEIEGIPLVPELQAMVERVVDQHQGIILTTAGRLPSAAVNMPAIGKLTTIHGLAASPRVITIGYGDPAFGVDPGSRLGPTATLVPKPDFLAPGIAGKSASNVMNVLPYVEAFAVRGLRHTELMRAALAGFATPTTGQSGLPATFYEQGYGTLDLGSLFDWTTTENGTQQIADALGLTEASVRDRVKTTLGVSDGALASATPSQILGSSVDGEPLLRAAVSKTLLNLTIDTPALPAQLQADFGVVNHKLPGYAAFVPIDLDSVIDATSGSLRLLLQEAGYTGTELDTVAEELLDLIRIRAEAGQDVTLNVTHYEFLDLLQDDFLYTIYSEMLGVAYADHGALLQGVTENEVEAAQQLLEAWLLEPHYLVEERSGTASLEAVINVDCEGTIPVEGITTLYDTVRNALIAEASMLSRTAKAPQAAEILHEIPTGDEIARERTRRYLQYEFNQLTCLEDQKVLIQNLRQWTLELHALKKQPWGSLTEAESWSGQYQETVLGEQIASTAVDLGVDPASLAQQNSTLILEHILDLLDRAYALTLDRLDLIGKPNVAVDALTGPTILSTLPERTNEAPLGLYIGLARMKSHNVTVRNPFTGETVAQRNVTIPLPSFLWNNPTLEYDIQYRDETPISDTAVRLNAPEVRIFDSITVNFTAVQNGTIVPIIATPTVLDQERGGLQARLAELDALLADPLPNAPGGYDTSTFVKDHFTAARDAVSERIEALDLLNADPQPERGTNVTNLLAPILDSILASLVSRSDHQWNVTNETGRAKFHNLFPGTYTLYQPYPYPVYIVPDQDPAPIASGKGGLAGPLVNLQMEVSKDARQFVASLPEHPTAADPVQFIDETSEDQLPACAGVCEEFKPVEIEGDKHGPYHQFGLSLHGPDPLGLGCAALKKFLDDTDTLVTVEGCGSGFASPVTGADAKAVKSFLDCVLGKPHAPLAVDKSELCVNVRADFEDLRIGCEANDVLGCIRFAESQNIFKAFEAVSIELGYSPENTDAPVPFLHNPVRLALRDPASIGLTPEDLLAATQELNPGSTKTQEQLKDDIRAVIENLDDFLADLVHVTPPAREAKENLTQVQGLVYHVTDKVTGLDWHRLGAEVNAGVTDDAAVLGLLTSAAQSVVHDNDKERAEDLVDAAEANTALLAEDLSTGLAIPLSTKIQRFGAGWRPLGLRTLEGLDFTGEADNAVLTVNQHCHDLAMDALLTEGYVVAEDRCPGISSTSQRAEIRGYGSVDKVQFASAMVERLAQAPTDLKENATFLGATVNYAASMSVMPTHESWYRSTDGIELTTAPGEPALGVLLYQTPVPVQEYLLYRMSAEVQLQNTGLLVVTTVDPAIVELILTTLGTLDAATLQQSVTVPSQVDPNVEETLDNIDNVQAGILRLVEALSEGTDPTKYLRVDLLGMPVAATEDDDQDLGTDKKCVVCERGMVVAGPDGYYAYNRTHEMETKGLDGAFGADELLTVLLYFPTALPSPENVATRQELVIRDFRLQLSTYLGLGNPGGRDTNEFSATLPLRYHPKLEEWQMMYAIPDQALGLDGVDATFTTSVNTHTPSSGQVLAGLTSNLDSRCADTVAPGYPTISRRTAPRLLPAGEDQLFMAASDPCDTDTTEGLRPVHVLLPFTVENWTTSSPKKEFSDVLRYTVGMKEVQETFTKFGATKLDFPCNILCDLTALGLAPAPRTLGSGLPTDPAVTAVQGLKDGLAAATSGVVESISDSGISIERAIPLFQPSFIPSAQHSSLGPHVAGPPRHHFVVLDETHAKTLIGTTNNTELGLLVHDISTPNADRSLPLRTVLHGTIMPTLPDTDARALVIAYQSVLATEQIVDEGVTQRVIHEASLFAGLGSAAIGVALRVTSYPNATFGDNGTKSFVDSNKIHSDSALLVDVYHMGGAKTAASDCKDVPLAGYVGPYFRCRGASAFNTGISLSAAAGSTCYGEALAFVTLAELTALRTADTAAQTAFGRLTENTVLVQEILGSPETAPYVADKVARDLDEYQLRLLEYVETGRQLAACLEVAPVPGAEIGDISGFINSLAQSRTLFSDGKLAEAGEAANGALAILQPALAAGGEPPALSTAGLQVAIPVPNVGAYTQTGALAYDYGVEEWTSLIAYAALNLTITPEAGSPTTRVIARTDAGPSLTTVAALSSAIFDAGVAIDEEAVYLFGGRTAAGRVGTIQRYDIATGVTTTLAATLPACALPGVANMGEVAYIFGCGSKVLRFDFDIGTVTQLSAETASTSIEGMGVAVTGSKVLLFGGLRLGPPSATLLTTIREYDPLTDSLVVKPGSLTNARYRFGTIWDGTQVYLLGGADATFSASAAVQRYEPVTGTLSLAPATLPYAIFSAATAYDPTTGFAYLLGGQGPSTTLKDTIIRYSPGLGGEVMGPKLPVATRESAAIWNGAEAITLGGRTAAGPLGSVSILSPTVELEPNAPGTSQVVRRHGEDVVLRIEGHDSLGNPFADEVSFVTDILPPEITTLLADIIYLAAAGDLTWTVEDSTTGIGTVDVEKCTNANTCTPWTVVGEPDPAGTQLPFDVTRTLDHDALVRISATDVAGNVAQKVARSVVFDNVIPQITGTILEALASGIVPTPDLTLDVLATDDDAGLATLTFWLENHTAEFEHLGLGGQAEFAAQGLAELVPANETYTLVAHAEDLAGNEAEVRLHLVMVQVAPTTTTWVTERLFEDVGLALYPRFNATVPEYGADVHYATMTLWGPGGSLIQTETWVPTSGQSTFAGTPWNATGLTGTYKLNTTAHYHRANWTVNMTLNMTGPSQIGSIQNLEAFATQGTLYNPDDYALYRLTQGTKCGGRAEFHIDSPTNKGIMMYITEGDPTLFPQTDPALYTHQAAAGGWIEITSMKPTYALLVRTTTSGSDSPWTIQYVTDGACSLGGAVDSGGGGRGDDHGNIEYPDPSFQG